MKVEFVMNEPYLREFHAEMVATRLPRWRRHRRLALASVAASVILAGWAGVDARLDAVGVAALPGLVGGWMLWRLRARRQRWLAYQKRLPTFGAHVTTVVERGRLLQSSDRSSDVVGIPRGEILESPRGWFVTYDIVHLGTEVTDEAVSTTRSSVYLPERGFEPGVTREAFAAALAETFVVRRL